MQRQGDGPIAECAAAEPGWSLRARFLLGFLANQFARLVQALVAGVGLILLVMFSTDIPLDSGLRFVLLMPLWFALCLLGIAAHEFGHYAAARLMGMRVTSLQIWRLECAPQRRGMRMRWISGPRLPGASGHVIAFADPSRPIRAAHLVMTAGGIAANLAVTGLFGLVGATSTGTVPTLCLMFATINLVLGLVNLVPHQGKVTNDGYLLVQLLRGVPDMFQHPHLRLISLTLFGRTADQLPEEDLAAMEREAFPLPIVSLGYRLKARQNLGDWSAAAAMQGDLDSLLGGKSAAECAGARPLIDCIRTELAFSRAMHTGASDALTDDLLPKPSAWYAPHLWPRCQALKAAIAGDLPTCRHWLDRAGVLADNEVDASLATSERMIRASMASAFPGAFA